MPISYDRLLDGPPWIRYRVMIDLLKRTETDEEAASQRKRAVDSPEIRIILDELQQWPGTVLKSHKNASHAIHKLSFLADLGLTIDDSTMDSIAEKILRHQSAEGPFEILMNIPTHFGGSGTERFLWMLCDAPLIAYSLIRLGLGSNVQVKKSVDHLLSLVRENGWPCAASPGAGKFRGPGKKADPCPYANLMMLKLLSQIPEMADSREAGIGAETLLSLRDMRKEKKPYLFAMGTDFQKLKAPLVWYDILHLLDVLSLFPRLHSDSRFQDMLELVESKKDGNGLFTAESVWQAWKGWEFCQKKQPSYWISFLVYRILDRVHKA